MSQQPRTITTVTDMNIESEITNFKQADVGIYSMPENKLLLKVYMEYIDEQTGTHPLVPFDYARLPVTDQDSESFYRANGIDGLSDLHLCCVEPDKKFRFRIVNYSNMEFYVVMSVDGKRGRAANGTSASYRIKPVTGSVERGRPLDSAESASTGSTMRTLENFRMGDTLIPLKFAKRAQVEESAGDKVDLSLGAIDLLFFRPMRFSEDTGVLDTSAAGFIEPNGRICSTAALPELTTVGITEEESKRFGISVDMSNKVDLPYKDNKTLKRRLCLEKQFVYAHRYLCRDALGCVAERQARQDDIRAQQIKEGTANKEAEVIDLTGDDDEEQEDQEDGDEEQVEPAAKRIKL